MASIRNAIFVQNEIYHVFNRSNSNESIFVRNKEISRAIDLLSFYRLNQPTRFSFFNRMIDNEKNQYVERMANFDQNVDIFCYALMPNHYHLLLRQMKPKGIQTFLSNFQNGYAKYFNVRNKRCGALFQRPFKTKHVGSDEQFLHTSRYIHLNPVTAFMIEAEELSNSRLTSFNLYTKGGGQGVNVDYILSRFGSASKYFEFTKNQVDYQRRLAEIKQLMLD